MSSQPQAEFSSFLEQWSSGSGLDVLTASEATDRYGRNTQGITRQILGAIRPLTVRQIQDIVRSAGHYGVSLYPISTGNNWGYGSANPVTDGCIILDLGGMKGIVDFDPQLGLVTVEPGVTQRDLHVFLRQQDSAFMVPVTGAGPHCSLLGNAVERGYGITPFADHFGAVTAIEAVLPDGEIYRSMLDRLGGTEIDKAFKWGMGPYLDGLFTQGNFGIVTRMTLALAPKPERVEAFFFSVPLDPGLEETVEAVQQVLRQLGGTVGSINLMNLHRVLSMTEPYPVDHLGPDGLIPETWLEEKASTNLATAWTGLGGLYGTKRMATAARSEIRRILKGKAKRLVFFNSASAARLESLLRATPILNKSKLAAAMQSIQKTLQILSGEPSQIALPLCYWLTGNCPPPTAEMSPDRDNCGLLWYSPLIPMRPRAVRQYVEMVKTICRKHRIEPLITLTTLSDRCFDSTVPILFDKQDGEAMERAHRCYEELMRSGQEHGFLPYRLGVQSMSFLAESKAVPPVLYKLKKAVDPDGIIAPGRYLPGY